MFLICLYVFYIYDRDLLWVGDDITNHCNAYLNCCAFFMSVCELLFRLSFARKGVVSRVSLLFDPFYLWFNASGALIIAEFMLCVLIAIFGYSCCCCYVLWGDKFFDCVFASGALVSLYIVADFGTCSGLQTIFVFKGYVICEFVLASVAGFMVFIMVYCIVFVVLGATGCVSDGYVVINPNYFQRVSFCLDGVFLGKYADYWLVVDLYCGHEFDCLLRLVDVMGETRHSIVVVLARCLWLCSYGASFRFSALMTLHVGCSTVCLLFWACCLWFAILEVYSVVLNLNTNVVANLLFTVGFVVNDGTLGILVYFVGAYLFTCGGYVLLLLKPSGVCHLLWVCVDNCAGVTVELPVELCTFAAFLSTYWSVWFGCGLFIRGCFYGGYYCVIDCCIVLWNGSFVGFSVRAPCGDWPVIVVCCSLASTNLTCELTLKFRFLCTNVWTALDVAVSTSFPAFSYSLICGCCVLVSRVALRQDLRELVHASGNCGDDGYTGILSAISSLDSCGRDSRVLDGFADLADMFVRVEIVNW
eukprot:gene3437-2388_t